MKAADKENEMDYYENQNEQNGGPLIEHKSTNAMNNMLPCVRQAQEEAADLSEKRKLEDEILQKKRLKTGLKQFYDKQQ